MSMGLAVWYSPRRLGVVVVIMVLVVIMVVLVIIIKVVVLYFRVTRFIFHMGNVTS